MGCNEEIQKPFFPYFPHFPVLPPQHALTPLNEYIGSGLRNMYAFKGSWGHFPPIFPTVMNFPKTFKHLEAFWVIFSYFPPLMDSTHSQTVKGIRGHSFTLYSPIFGISLNLQLQHPATPRKQHSSGGKRERSRLSRGAPSGFWHASTAWKRRGGKGRTGKCGRGRRSR